MTYKIEIYENPISLPEWEFKQHFNSLPYERRVKVLKYRQKIDKNLSLLAYVLLRRGLEKWYGIKHNEILRFDYNENEKPSLADYPHIHFNISHCHEAVVCVFSAHPIGVDVEGLIELDKNLLERIANPQEYKSIVDAEDSSLAFTTLWTKKESYMKMTGTGLVDDLHSVLITNFKTNTHFEHIYPENKKYVLSVCELF